MVILAKTSNRSPTVKPEGVRRFPIWIEASDCTWNNGAHQFAESIRIGRRHLRSHDEHRDRRLLDDLGEVVVAVDNSVLLVRVSGSTQELNELALRAFNTHGRYKLVASGFLYDIRFSPAGPAQGIYAKSRGTRISRR